MAWLRSLGMPLARIRMVCDAEPVMAANEVAAYWAQVVAETATRADLAAFLVDYLSGKATAMSDAPTTLGIRFAAQSDIGLVRARNEDRAYAGSRVLAVADGMGGHSGGVQASAAAIDALTALEQDGSPADPMAALSRAVGQASDKLRALVESGPELDGLGTTLTAFLWSGSQLALAHVGDSRAYVLRDGELFRLTEDHTYVQSLVREGQISAEEAAAHPQRQLLLRALDGATDPQPDLSLHAVQPVSDLIGLARAAGGPDNIACAVADVVNLTAGRG